MSAIIKDVQIGDCRLILGNSIEVMPELGEFDHLISDPPYEQSMHDLHNQAEFRRKDGGADRKHFEFSGIDEIRRDLVRLAQVNCRGWFLAFCTAEGVAHWRAAIAECKTLKFKTTCAWIKPDCTPKFNGQGPAIGYEPFITVWAGKGHARWNAGGKRGIYTHLTNPKDRHGGHPTEKPWRLFSEIVGDFSNAGDIVCDPFMGSGTTLVSCAKLGRKGIGIELDPQYFEIACERVERAYEQADFFVQPPAKPIQKSMTINADGEVRSL